MRTTRAYPRRARILTGRVCTGYSTRVPARRETGPPERRANVSSSEINFIPPGVPVSLRAGYAGHIHRGFRPVGRRALRNDVPTYRLHKSIACHPEGPCPHGPGMHECFTRVPVCGFALRRLRPARGGWLPHRQVKDDGGSLALSAEDLELPAVKTSYVGGDGESDT